jgi:hypothetical protein
VRRNIFIELGLFQLQKVGKIRLLLTIFVCSHEVEGIRYLANIYDTCREVNVLEIKSEEVHKKRTELKKSEKEDASIHPTTEDPWGILAVLS